MTWTAEDYDDAILREFWANFFPSGLAFDRITRRVVKIEGQPPCGLNLGVRDLADPTCFYERRPSLLKPVSALEALALSGESRGDEE